MLQTNLTKNEALEVYQIINEIKPPKAIYKLNFSLYLYDLEKFEERENVLNEAVKLFEEQKNNFEEDIINKFEKNLLKLKKELSKNKKFKFKKIFYLNYI